jgi:hypothetical protein
MAQFHERIQLNVIKDGEVFRSFMIYGTNVAEFQEAGQEAVEAFLLSKGLGEEDMEYISFFTPEYYVPPRVVPHVVSYPKQVEFV